MPELPEVETSCRGIAPHLEQQQVTDVIIRQAKLRWPIPTDLKHKLVGQNILHVSRRGKYILIQAESGCLLLHLGMSGNVRILPSDAPILKHDHVDIVLATGKCLRFNDPRRFGCLLWTTTNPHQHKLLRRLGPEPLTDDFNIDYLFQQSRHKKINVKQFIMNSQIVVGIGNIYASEALFSAGILPTRVASSISKARYAKLIMEIKKVLQHSIDIGGTTLRDFVNSDGKPGYFKQQLQVYGRAGQVCHHCDNNLKMLQINKRSTFFCHHCQT